MTKFGELLRALSCAGVRFVLLSGLAATAHRSTRGTQDLDVVYSRDRENLHRVYEALSPHAAALRGAPEDVAFHLDAVTLAGGLSFMIAAKRAAGRPRDLEVPAELQLLRDNGRNRS